MEYNEFSTILKEESTLINVMLNDKQIQDFYKYMNMLIQWNEKINLTAIIEPKDIIKKHFIDSLTILKYINENDTVIDIGTGAGFPGIPIKIAKNNIDVTLLDSLNKRINFLNEVINENKLENISAVHSRVEDFAKNNREKFNVVTSRAVASLNVLLEYMLPLVKIGGKCVCMKGSNIEEEIKDSKKALEILGGKITKIDEFNLPNTDMQRNIIIIEKVKSTPKTYPRKAGMATKSPIV